MIQFSDGPRQHWPMALVLLLLAVVYFPLALSDELASLGGDSAVYLQVAKHYAPYLADNPVSEHSARNSQFPPLFPVWLALTGGAERLLLAHLATVAALLGAAAALYLWMTGAGIPRIGAALLLLGFGLLPGTWFQALTILSEPLYLLVSVAALATMQSVSKSGGRRAVALAAALVAAAILTRSVGVALVPAFAAALWRARVLRWPWWAVASLVPFVVWSLVHRPERSYADGFLDHLIAETAHWDVLWWRLTYDAVSLWQGFVDNLMQTDALVAVVAGLAGFGVGAALMRLRRAQPDAVYFFAYVTLIVIWPYPAESMRFAWLLVPQVLAYAVMGAIALARRVSSASPRARSLVSGLPIGVLLLISAPQFLLLEARFAAAAHEADPRVGHLPEWYGPELRVARGLAEGHLQLAAAIRNLGREIPEGECAFCIKPALVAFHADRNGFNPPAENTADPEFDREVRQRGCRYFLVVGISSPSYSAPFYPVDRLGDKAEVVAMVESEGQPVAGLLRLTGN